MKVTSTGAAAVLLVLSLPALADGLAVDKVYHPYVDPLVWELEWRAIVADDNPATGEGRSQLHRFSVGRAVAPNVMLEAYLLGSDSEESGFAIEAYELETLWQITEQGEYALDYGLLFELEKERGEDSWESAVSLLLERELGRFSVAANLEAAYEWGDDIRDEWETGLALQGRYRYRPEFEPAVEFYKGEDTAGLGPAGLGNFRLGPGRSLHWEAAVIVGLDSATPDYTLRTLLEYEF
ncbi:hypothetical protein [Parahaliea aestuarii]|uniref:Transporter n=1 Tax=Parahaliea aestuarii TaxID=1852021 RepID=A0A5C9A3I0_9GAMM|nr:hypothetical protein [Parahaliea aestuarii]TXS94554.1 hypothetical protein FVW59_01120 [Parahaliea aestuarii]